MVTGNLRKTVSYPVGTNPHGLDAGDFNGDGHLDLAVSNRSSRDLHLLMGDGDGAFLLRAPIPTGQDIIALAARDFDGDTHADLALVSATSHAVILWKGDGAGQFTPFAAQQAGEQQ